LLRQYRPVYAEIRVETLDAETYNFFKVSAEINVFKKLENYMCTRIHKCR